MTTSRSGMITLVSRSPMFLPNQHIGGVKKYLQEVFGCLGCLDISELKSSE